MNLHSDTRSVPIFQSLCALSLSSHLYVCFLHLLQSTKLKKMAFKNERDLAPLS